MKKTRHERGFTLVELVVVLAMIGILAAIAIPNILGNLPTYRLRAAARDLVGRMQTARQLAVKNNANAGIVFDPTNNRYTLYSSGPDGTWGNTDDVVVEVVNLSGYGSGVGFGSGGATKDATTTPATITTPLEVTFPSGQVVFTPDGFANQMGYCYLRNQNNDSFAIGTLPSGVIYLKKWAGSTSGWQ